MYSNNREYKIFVGNVPFDCTTLEFINCFKYLEGYVTCDIIKRYNSKISRGFGFIILTSKDQANKLLNEKNFKLKDRTLRFNKYISQQKKYKTVTTRYQTDPKLAYQEGYMAGHTIGYQEGFKKGIEHQKTIDQYHDDLI